MKLKWIQKVGNGCLEAVINFLSYVGRSTLNGCANVGNFFIFIANVCRGCVTPPFYFKMFIRQLLEIGFFSLSVIVLTAFFTGAALALQTFAGTSRFSAESTVPTVVAIALTRELGPVLSALMVAGRVGAAIAAELGTMKVTEQLDAMRTLSVNPLRYLVVPRILAGMIALPCLVFISDVIGIMGGLIVSVLSLDFLAYSYLDKTMEFLEPIDIISGLIKAAVFGFVITLVGSYCGYHSNKGAKGVGQSTTNAVVFSSILILSLNYVMTEFFFV